MLFNTPVTIDKDKDIKRCFLTWSTLSFLKALWSILKLLMASVSCFDEYFTLFRGIVPVTWTADHKHEKCC